MIFMQTKSPVQPPALDSPPDYLQDWAKQVGGYANNFPENPALRIGADALQKQVDDKNISQRNASQPTEKDMEMPRGCFLGLCATGTLGAILGGFTDFFDNLM